MDDSSDSTQDSSCECQQLINLTEAGEISSLDTALKEQLKIILKESKFHLYKASDKLNVISNAKIKTSFDLNDKQNSIGKLVVEKNLDDAITQQIDSLIKVYQNQYRLISRINHDQLTKLGNRLALDNKFKEILGFKENKRKRKNENYCLAIFDIDHFKSINDQYGHLYGDEVLVHLSQLMIKTFRDSDYLFRYGGEEFVVILSDLELEQAIDVMDRFRQKVSDYEFPLVGDVTVSFGLTQIDRLSDSVTNIGRADKALYFAKENGRNQVRVFETLIKDGHLQDDKPADDDITLFS